MYIPSSQYKTGYYSNGEYILNGVDYVGPYWRLSNGDLFTGENPSESSQRLLPKPLATNEDGQEIPEPIEVSEAPDNLIVADDLYLNTNYKRFQEKPLPRLLPSPYYPTLTPNDITNKQFSRFFSKKNNSYEYMEITENDYYNINSQVQDFAYDLYGVVSLTWIIDGSQTDVFNQNKKSVLEIELPASSRFPKGKDWLGFSQIFKDNYLQFFQGIQENLSTSGGKYKTSNGKEYIGDYHIHPEKGPMVGAKHINEPHDYLYPINKPLPIQETTGSIEVTPPTQTETPSYTPPPTQTPSYTPPPSTGGGSFGGGGY